MSSPMPIIIKIREVLFVVVGVSVILCVSAQNSSENNTAITISVGVENATAANTTIDKITQPSQIQNIERVFHKSASVNISDKLDFRPSPLLETTYEYNKFPVVPAAPEAKHLSPFNTGEAAANFGGYPWRKNDPSRTSITEKPWVNRVVFPQPTVPTSKDQPYPFLTSQNNNKNVLMSKTFGVSPPYSSPSPYDFEKPQRPRPQFSGYGYSGPSSAGVWDKFEAGVGDRRPAVEKTHAGDFYGLSEKPAGASAISPIKKIISILAAFIPIGLLISALTPSVIQITPVNMTQMRSRSKEENLSKKRLVSSLNHLQKFDADVCEERVLCELLLSAGASNDAEKHVENLLQAFTEQERDAFTKAEELQKIYEAVRKQNCQLLFCENTKGHRKKETLELNAQQL